MVKRKLAAALKYDSAEGGAPTVVASGHGELAERIINTAAEHGVPIEQDSLLAPLLVGLNLNEAIPPELYKAVATILATIFAIDKPQN